MRLIVAIAAIMFGITGPVIGVLAIGDAPEIWQIWRFAIFCGVGGFFTGFGTCIVIVGDDLWNS